MGSWNIRRLSNVGPEIARLVEEFQGTLFSKARAEGHKAHHESTAATQQSFISDVSNFVALLEDLCSIILKEMMSSGVADNVRKTEKLGKGQYHAFVTAILQDAPTSSDSLTMFDTIPKKQLLLSNKRVKSSEASSAKLEMA